LIGEKKIIKKMEKRVLLYKTLSLCPKCSFIERNGIKWVNSEVIGIENEVWLIIEYKLKIKKKDVKNMETQKYFIVPI
jgi:hypothetical protein